MTTQNQKSQEPKTVNVTFNQNVKYRGEFYKAGAKLDVQADDHAGLMKDGVIKVESDDDDN